MAKHQMALCATWLAPGEAFRRGDPAFEPAKADLRAAIAERLKEDDTVWHGWYRRHGGEIEMIGDHFGGSDVHLGAAGAGRHRRCSGRWRRQCPRRDVSAPAAAKPKSSRSRHKR